MVSCCAITRWERRAVLIVWYITAIRDVDFRDEFWGMLGPVVFAAVDSTRLGLENERY